MKTGASLKNRQGGAVAVMVGISMVVLIGFLAMVIDLGRLYVARAGLQNAADAAALSGAKELHGTLAGISSAVAKAVETGELNSFFGNLGRDPVELGSGNDLNNTNIWFSSSPSGPNWYHGGDSQVQNNPGDKLFIKVDTASGNLTTWFAPIWSIFTTSTYGSAVAGPLMTNIAPIGLCVLSTDKYKWVQYDAGGDSYKAEFGYMRGVNYNFGVINGALAGLGPGTELYLHPTATDQAACIQSQGSADFAAPFLCTGRSVISGAPNSVVYTNTGIASGKSIAALNTRFDQYGPPLDNSLDSSVCPPDVNTREYTPGAGNGGANNWMGAPQRQDSALLLDDWLASAASSVRAPLPSSVRDANLNAGGCAGNCDDNYGVLWSYNRPAASGVSAASGVAVTTDWPQLFPSGISSVPATPGPTYTGNASLWAAGQSPYSYGLQSLNATYYKEPAQNGQPNRRLLNVVLVQCPAASGGICRPMMILGVGRFFMQRTATQSDGITGEFAGLVPESALKREIRLFR